MNYVLSRDFQIALTTMGARHLQIKPHCPWQNGKVCEESVVVLHRAGLTPAKV
jgi:hypothetical protein